MTRVLWLAAGYNLLAGIGMLCLRARRLQAAGHGKARAGTCRCNWWACWWRSSAWATGCVALDPVTNRNVLLLGFLTKLLGPLLALYYVAVGKLPPVFIAVLLVSDLVYLPPFAAILLHIHRQRQTLLDSASDHGTNRPSVDNVVLGRSGRRWTGASRRRDRLAYEKIVALRPSGNYHEKQGRSTGLYYLDGPHGPEPIYLKKYFRLPWRTALAGPAASRFPGPRELDLLRNGGGTGHSRCPSRSLPAPTGGTRAAVFWPFAS